MLGWQHCLSNLWRAREHESPGHVYPTPLPRALLMSRGTASQTPPEVSGKGSFGFLRGSGVVTPGSLGPRLETLGLQHSALGGSKGLFFEGRQRNLGNRRVRRWAREPGALWVVANSHSVPGVISQHGGALGSLLQIAAEASPLLPLELRRASHISGVIADVDGAPPPQGGRGSVTGRPCRRRRG